MKKLTILFTTSLLTMCHQVPAQSIYESSPINYANSPINPENSPINYRNSPINPANSPINPNSHNGVYNDNGERIGYAVPNNQGTVNIFDNNGNRIGYNPRGYK